jgi:hypothetical protein
LSAAELDLSALADSGYESTGHGIKTAVKQSADGKPVSHLSVRVVGINCMSRASFDPRPSNDLGRATPATRKQHD